MCAIKKIPTFKKILIGDLYFQASEDRKSAVVVGYSELDLDYEELIVPESITFGGEIFPVTEISIGALRFLKTVKKILIPDSIIKIGRSPFFGSMALTSIFIGKRVQYIHGTAFNNCPSLCNIEISDENPYFCFDDGVLFTRDKTKLLNCLTCKEGVFVIPNSVKVITDWAFYNCSHITSITIPCGLTCLGQNVFYGCSSLSEVVWNAKYFLNFSYYTGQYFPFQHINELIKSFKFGDNVVHIPAYICYGMKNLKSISFPKNVTTIGTAAFERCCLLESVTLNSNVRNIGDRAFKSCTSLKNISIPNSVLRIGVMAFSNCSAIENLVIPPSVNIIEEKALENCYYTIYL